MNESNGRPLVVGLTGQIGTGKSHVRATMVSLGAEGIDADKVAHAVMEPGGAAHADVVAVFGPDILASDGAIDRTHLGAKVFGEPALLARLESIVHPAVFAEIQRRVNRSKAPAVVIEAIKLLEAGYSSTVCDQIWVTTCSRRQQFSRLRASRGLGGDAVRSRLAHQMQTSELLRQADLVIDTGGTMAETALKALAGWVDLGLPLPPPVIRPVTIADAEGTAAVLNSIVREGGRTVAGRTYTPAQERAFLRSMPERSQLNVALLGAIVVGFQETMPYATYTPAMDHVASAGTFIAAPVRGRGLGHALSAVTWKDAKAAGYAKLVITVREDNSEAQAFYAGMGFRHCGRLTRQAFVDGRFVDELIYEAFLE